MTVDTTKERIRKLFNNVELSVSSYDTAWVAMVPSPDSPKSPCFPDCLNWLMDNQLDDGSWGLVHNDAPLLKDTLSSTLACILALKRWNVGEHHINKGLSYIESNIASATDKDQPSPFGFDIIFPHMLEYAKNLKINLPLKKIELSSMLYDSELEIRRCDSKERQAYLAYVSEGLGNFYDWNMVMKYQMKNGSVLNSPSATAAALIHRRTDPGCLDYLSSILDKFGNAVPTVYPLDLYTHLSMVDTLKRLGIARHFTVEIQNVLDETYRCWMQGDEQLFMDVVTCSLAFRLLRTHGYQVTSDPLAKLTNEGAYNMKSCEEPFKDIHAALEVYRASNIIYQDETGFGQLHLRSTDFLRRKISTSSDRLSQSIHKEVDIALKFPANADLERMSSRRNIENYIIDDTRFLKTSYRSSNISNEHYLLLAVEDFNACQSIYRRELESINRWVVDCRLDQLKFARQKEAYCYFSAASTMSSPELSYARMTWAKCSIICTVFDDFYDTERSMDEWTNLIHCIEKWDVDVATDCYSETVAIIFKALKDLVCWIGDKAVEWQERDVTSHVIRIWLELANSMLSEAIWTRDACVPTMNDYMEAAYPSIGLGVTVLPALYFVGPKLSEEIIQSSEYHNLFRLMSTHARLRNDIRGFKRESNEGKLNAVTLHEKYGKCGIDESEVIEDILTMINNQERDLMKLVMEEKGSIVPRACKDIFWTTSNILNLFYATYDGFSGNGILDIVKEVIYEPVSID